MTTHSIGLDVHCPSTEYAVVTSSGRLPQNRNCFPQKSIAGAAANQVT
jgi:hypothetical protein